LWTTFKIHNDIFRFTGITLSTHTLSTFGVTVLYWGKKGRNIVTRLNLPPKNGLKSPHARLHIHLHHKPLTISPPLSMFTSNQFTSLRTRRGELAVAKASPPNSTSLILAFVLPFSLLAGTIFTSAHVADRLDEKLLEDVMQIITQAILHTTCLI